MDESKFDDILKGKLESHIDPGGPPPGQMARMLDDLPSVSSYASSSTVKYLAAASAVLFLTTIFLIYRTFMLEERIIELHQVGNSTLAMNQISGGESIIYYDSIAKRSYRRVYIDQDGQRLDTIYSSNYTRSGAAYRPMTALDSQVLVNQAMTQLIETMKSDPELLSEILPEGTADQPVFYASAPTSTSQPELANDGMESTRGASIGLTPEEREALYNELRNEIIASLEQEQRELQKAISDSLASADSNEEQLIPIDSVEVMEEDSAAVARRQEMREQQKKIANRSWSLYGGMGPGIAPTSFGNMFNGAFLGGVEYKFNKYIGVSSGLEYHIGNGESYEIDDLDLSVFEDLTAADLADAKELKFTVQWMDIPLEAKVYLMPDKKFQPYALVSLRSRLLLSESYKFETFDDQYLNADVEDGKSFSFPSVGYGAGFRVPINSKLDYAMQLQHSVGGQSLGGFNEKFNSVQGHALLIIKLK
ncbi:outer membrane beta-barrel protein [Reichenbachiella versicolor]|uniref:outer membrane beta-barrel protein n=1 Tax=Reichenbachiella versicolor TaxID=1821036 RepID=UPI000D6DE784|nr:outer membrane beta-barrel protein [Reichenbachiella versicolor]